MNEYYEIKLRGCTPEPLMSYLKALGVLRLVSDQSDSEAAAWWRAGVLVLRSKLDWHGLLGFFLEQYRPTPIAGPWAGGSGFFKGDNTDAVRVAGSSLSPRSALYRKVIDKVREILKEEGIEEKPGEEAKQRLLRRYRRELPDEFVQWMDAAMVLEADAARFAPVLGTGGNDGRLDFTQNFMQRLVELKLLDAEPKPEALPLLRLSLFGEPTRGLGKGAVGQFAPGRAGGPNATQGMEGGSTDNPWDFVLMLEGTLMLAGAAVRRIGAQKRGRAAFPFTVSARPVGGTGPSEDELATARGELWLPLWDHPVTAQELLAVFAEGRADVSRRPVRDSVDFARAVAGLGIDRGIRSFVRYSFLKRSGKAYLATAMEEFRVPESVREGADLLSELDAWLEGFRRGCSGKEAPARLKAALRRIEGEIFDYCRHGRREDLEGILTATGRAERELAVTGGRRGGQTICLPCGGLSPEWLKATHDGRVEYEIALALAGIYDPAIGSLRCNVEPVSFEKGRWQWATGGLQVVWSRADLAANFAAILDRRMMDAERSGAEGLGLEFGRSVRLGSIARFLARDVDEGRIEDLLWGLSLINHSKPYPQELPHASDEAPPLARAYAVLKLLFLPRPLVWEPGREGSEGRWRLARPKEKGIRPRSDRRILGLLRADRLGDACEIAGQRLRAAGFEPMPKPRAWEEHRGIDARRLAGALLLPLGSSAVNRLVALVTRKYQPAESIVSEGVEEDE